MFKLFYKLKSAFLTFFGDIKVYPFPMFVVYCPDSFRIKGADTRAAMKQIHPGDLVLRKYRHYLDGFFIPGRFSHTGIYVGHGKVIHAVAEGVSEIDLIDFLRCDAFAIVRPKAGAKNAIEKLYGWLGKPYDFDFKSGNDRYYCHELAAEAYRGLAIEKFPTTLFGLKLPFLSKKYLADSFLASPDFRVITERKPNSKEVLMKKALALVIIAVAVTAIVTGCTAIQSATASFHGTAVSFAKSTSKAKALDKIQELVDEKKITPEYGAELSAKAETEIDAIFVKIDELYAKYKALKEAKKAEKAAEETGKADAVTPVAAPVETKAE